MIQPYFSSAPARQRSAGDNRLGAVVQLSMIVGAWLVLLPLAPFHVAGAWTVQEIKRRRSGAN